MSSGQQTDVSNIHSAEGRVTWLVWLRLVLGAVGIFCAYVGVFAGLASAVSKYGFQWHPLILETVNYYRSNVYPLYDHVFQVAASFLDVNWHLPAFLRDPITILGLAFAAANFESLVRDRQLLLVNVFRASWRAAFTRTRADDERWDREYRRNGVDLPPSTAPESIGAGIFSSLARNRLVHMSADQHILGPILPFVFSLGWTVVVVYAVWRPIILFGPAYFGWLPQWLKIWSNVAEFAIGQLFVVGLFLFWTHKGERFRKRLPLVVRRTIPSLFIIAGIATFPGIPFLLLLIFTLVVSGTLGYMTVFVLASPLIAWRSSMMTLTLFVALMLANWMLLNEGAWHPQLEMLASRFL